MAVVDPDERSAAAVITGVARSVGASGSQFLVGRLIALPGWLSAPFYLAGGLKTIYDLLLPQFHQASPAGGDRRTGRPVTMYLVHFPHPPIPSRNFLFRRRHAGPANCTFLGMCRRACPRAVLSR
jgi:hypothetical protein